MVRSRWLRSRCLFVNTPWVARRTACLADESGASPDKALGWKPEDDTRGPVGRGAAGWPTRQQAVIVRRFWNRPHRSTRQLRPWPAHPAPSPGQTQGALARLRQTLTETYWRLEKPSGSHEGSDHGARLGQQTKPACRSKLNESAGGSPRGRGLPRGDSWRNLQGFLPSFTGRTRCFAAAFSKP
jgi:hypothetical protein